MGHGWWCFEEKKQIRWDNEKPDCPVTSQAASSSDQRGTENW